MNKSKDKVIMGLLMAILKGINLLVIKQSRIDIDDSYTKYVQSACKLAEDYLNND